MRRGKDHQVARQDEESSCCTQNILFNLGQRKTLCNRKIGKGVEISLTGQASPGHIYTRGL